MPHDFFSFFVCNIEKPIVWRVSTRKIITVLQKNSRKPQASVTERCASVSKGSGIFWQNLLKVAVKKLNLYKLITTHELLKK